jgi:hypothetical protein
LVHHGFNVGSAGGSGGCDGAWRLFLAGILIILALMGGSIGRRISRGNNGAMLEELIIDAASSWPFLHYFGLSGKVMGLLAARLTWVCSLAELFLGSLFLVCCYESCSAGRQGCRDDKGGAGRDVSEVILAQRSG